MASPVQPVIIVKKKGGHHGHHGGAWKVAYADFVTAMMAFFLVMWLVGQSPQVKAGVGGYFRDPVGMSEGGRGVLPGADSIEVPKPQAPVDQMSEENLERQLLEDVVSHIKEGLDQVPAFQKLRDQVEFTVTPEGLRIDLIEKDDSSFFDSGSASLKGESIRLLAVIATELGKLDHHLDVEGHTDSHQFSEADRYSNWELSADRANAARRVMDLAGIRPEQVSSVRGMADRQLRVPDNPLDSRNRRVSIMVKSALMNGPRTPASALVPAAGPAPTVAGAGASHATDAASTDAAPHAAPPPAAQH